MTLLHQAAQKAVEAPAVHDAIREAGGIVHSDGNIFFTNAAKFMQAVAALQQQPEPVAVWQSQCKDGTWADCTEANARAGERYGFPMRALYTAPPALQHQEVPAAVRAALVELLAAHTEAAGFTMSMACDRQQFDEFLARTQKRVDDAVAQAQAALASSPSTTRQQEDGNV